MENAEEINAETDKKVTFIHGSAEDLSFCSDGSVDLITVGTALHWFDKDKFYAEVKRILKPDTGKHTIYIVACLWGGVSNKPTLGSGQ